jgi:hypothetical protein
LLFLGCALLLGAAAGFARLLQEGEGTSAWIMAPGVLSCSLGAGLRLRWWPAVLLAQALLLGTAVWVCSVGADSVTCLVVWFHVLLLGWGLGRDAWRGRAEKG